MAGNEQVIRTDRFTRALEFPPDDTVLGSTGTSIGGTNTLQRMASICARSIADPFFGATAAQFGCRDDADTDCFRPDLSDASSDDAAWGWSQVDILRRKQGLVYVGKLISGAKWLQTS